MKLSKIYSNKKSFKTITFNEQLNVILGKVTERHNREKDTHNLGKTTLISIIDFLLLKGLDKDHIFAKHKTLFYDYVFYLEIKLNSNKFVTIRRSVKSPSKVSLKIHKEEKQDFTQETIWDYENLGMNSRGETSPKFILNKLLEFDILPDFDYRQTVTYFLRSQEDYGDVFHLTKFIKGQDSVWKPFLFELLGFQKLYMQEKYKLQNEIDDQKKFIARIEKEYAVSTEEIDKIRGLIQIKEEEKLEAQRMIDNFDFYLKEKKLTKEIIEEIETDIANLNSFIYSLNFEIKKLQESIKLGFNFNLDEVEEIYREAHIYFPDQLKKDYQELVDFNLKVTNQRNKYLKEVFIEKQEVLKDMTERLTALNQKRSNMLSQLKEKDTFKKFKNYQSDISRMETEIEKLKFQLGHIDIVKSAKEKLKDLADKTQDKNDQIEKEVYNKNLWYDNIKKTFTHFTKKILHHPGILSIKINKSGNVEYKAEIANVTEKEITSKDKGHTYKKILCVCFDLCILVMYTNKSFYKFVYHDGSLESLDNRRKLDYLELVRELCSEYNIQYILTAIEHDLPITEEGKVYQFAQDEIALALDDSENNEGRLFELMF